MKTIIKGGPPRPIPKCEVCGINEAYGKCDNCTICKVCTSEFTLAFRHGDIVEMKCQKCNAYFEIVLTPAE